MKTLTKDEVEQRDQESGTSASSSPAAVEGEGEKTPKIKIEEVDFYYADFKALQNISLDIPEREVTAFIGPSGCGKSTLLRCINRMNDLVPGSRLEGRIRLDGEDLYDEQIDVVEVRRQVGMVFQKPNPFPKSIYENIVYAPRIHGEINSRAEADELVESSLRRAGLWEEVKDRLDIPGVSLSGGQQQRLCIARTIAVQPEVVLMDEPCSALDPIATATIEELISQLKEHFTVIIVTHNMQQATRVSDRTAFYYLGQLVEYGDTTKVFNKPDKQETEDYISGRFG